jgi:hypothetical protein
VAPQHWQEGLGTAASGDSARGWAEHRAGTRLPRGPRRARRPGDDRSPIHLTAAGRGDRADCRAGQSSESSSHGWARRPSGRRRAGGAWPRGPDAAGSVWKARRGRHASSATVRTGTGWVTRMSLRGGRSGRLAQGRLPGQASGARSPARHTRPARARARVPTWRCPRGGPPAGRAAPGARAAVGSVTNPSHRSESPPRPAARG